MKFKAIRVFLLAVGVSLGLVIPSTVSHAAEQTEDVSVQAEAQTTDPGDTGSSEGNTSGNEAGGDNSSTNPTENVTPDVPAQDDPTAEVTVPGTSVVEMPDEAESIVGTGSIDEAEEEIDPSGTETPDEEDTADTDQKYTYIKNLRKDFERIDKVYAVANVTSYLNVRESASSSGRIVGELSPNALCYIIADEDQEWVYIESGDVRGFVKAEYLITGPEAEMYVELIGEDLMETATIIVEPEENEAFDYVKKTVYNPVLNIKGEEIIAYARQFVGNPYVWGGNSLTEGIDCSHFVWQVLTNCGVYDGSYYTSYGWREQGEEVESLAEAQAGDVICYEGHVALYDGDGKIVEAQGRRSGITYGRPVDYRDIITIRRFTPETVNIDGYETEYLGNFRLTAYCDCSICCGRWANGYTASGVKPTAGRTIAIASSTMKRLGLEFGDQIYLRGHIYTIEDHGGSEMALTNDGLCIDIYCDTHEECFNAMYGGYDDAFKILGVKAEE